MPSATKRKAGAFSTIDLMEVPLLRTVLPDAEVPAGLHIFTGPYRWVILDHQTKLRDGEEGSDGKLDLTVAPGAFEIQLYHRGRMATRFVARRKVIVADDHVILYGQMADERTASELILWIEW